MGRRWGKTVLGGDISLATACAGGKVAWIVPEYKNGRPLWRWAEGTVAPLRRSKKVSVSRSERVIQFDNGGFLGIYSADNPDSLRGEWFNVAVLDEAARISEEAWQDAIQPTLADADGDAILISTPKGKNWFFQEWVRGQDPANAEQASWKAPTIDNPSPRIRAAAERARTKVPERTYRQEWLGEFTDDGGEVFRRVRSCVYTDPPPAPPKRKEDLQEGEQAEELRPYVMGVDWGRSNDFTWLTVMDMRSKRVVEMDRFNQIDFAYQRERLKNLFRKWQCEMVVAEANSIGQPNIEALVADNIPVFPFMTTNASKATIIERLVLAIENGTVSYPNDPVLVGELESFEMARTKLGAVTYSAPEGQHDDGVMSLALSLWGSGA